MKELLYNAATLVPMRHARILEEEGGFAGFQLRLYAFVRNQWWSVAISQFSLLRG